MTFGLTGRRAMATPTKERAPPTIARIGGTSLRKSQPSRMVIGGTAKVVTPNFPAVVWLSAYALVVARARDLLSRTGVRRALEALTGTVLVALGLRLAAEQR